MAAGQSLDCRKGKGKTREISQEATALVQVGDVVVTVGGSFRETQCIALYKENLQVSELPKYRMAWVL